MPRDRVTRALIPAAGRGTRFLPVTKVVPKELLPIVSTPALELVVLLPDDLIDDRDELLGPMLDVYDQYGGVVVGLLDVPRPEIRKYGCVTIGAVDGDVVEITDLVEKPQPEQAPSTLAIIARYV